MKKKIILLALGSTLAISTVAASLFIFNKGDNSNALKGTDTEYTITLNADDITTADAYESKTFTAYTDQLHNPVSFDATSVKQNGDYVEFKSQNNGSLGNSSSSAIYAMRSVDFYFYADNPAYTIKVEWGWKIDGTVQYLNSTNIYCYEPDGYHFVFEEEYPDYFRIVNDEVDEEDIMMLKKVVITYGDECETQHSYGYPYKVVNKIKYKRLIDHWTVVGFDDGESVSDLTFESEIDGLPVTEVGSHAFYFKSAVHTVDFGESNITNIGFNAFYCSGLTSVDFRDSHVTTLNESCFNTCSSLTDVYGLDLIEVFEDDCFSGSAITSATFGANLRRMNDTPFYGCLSLLTVTFSDACEPSYISQGSFNHSENIETVHIGSLMTQIPEFYNCNIKTFTVGPDPVQFKADAYGVLYSKHTESTYYLQRIPKGTELTSYTVPDDVDYLLLDCARDCVSLQTVTLNEHINSISSAAFRGCTNLATFNFAATNNVTYIYSEAFMGCTSLASITLPSNVKDISSDVFKNCTGLTSFTLPSGIKSIAPAFEGCSNIATIYYDGTVEEWKSSSIYKYSEWYNGISATVLTCTNGPINIEDAD